MSASPRIDGAAGCRDEARTLLEFHLNGSLTSEQDAIVRAHLESCPACMAELDELSSLAAAIERHGADTGFAAPRPWARRAALAAAMVMAASLAVYHWTPPRATRDDARGSAGSGEVILDLAAGSLRDRSGPPEAVLTPASRTVVISFFPPARPGARYDAKIVGDEGRTLLPAEPLAGLDAVGRATLRIPASALPPSGLCQVVVDVWTPEDGTRTFTYPFEVRRADAP